MTTCTLCGGDSRELYGALEDRLYGAQGCWNLRRCTACGLAWIDPPQAPERLAELYRGYYTHTPPPRRTAAVQRARTAVLTSRAAGSAARPLIRSHLISPLRMPALWRQLWLAPGTRGRALDVGCGNGAFLSALRSYGWDVAGIEPDPEAARLASDTLGLAVFNGPLEQAPFDEASFDLVTMNHVIEHLPDPWATLHACRRVLRPGGRLVIYTPNLVSLGHRVFQRHWLHLDPPRHLFLFSPEALETALQRAGMQIEVIKTFAQGAALSWTASRLLQRHGRLRLGWRAKVPRSITAQAHVFRLIERALVFTGAAGEELAVVAVRGTP